MHGAWAVVTPTEAEYIERATEERVTVARGEKEAKLSCLGIL